MQLILSIIFLLFATSAFSDLSDHLKTHLPYKPKQAFIDGIDYIYLINLDRRPERLENCLSQLKFYQIFPYRFPAVDAYDLSNQIKKDLGVVFEPGMRTNEWVSTVASSDRTSLENTFLREELYGKTVFFPFLTPGVLGCYLSHLSVLQNAYDAGYETIWIMEDDILIKKNPHLLAKYIKKLDSLIGKDGWDVLYTDMDSKDNNLYVEKNDFFRNLKSSNLFFFWRPDMDLSDHSRFAKRTVIDNDFIAIGSRMRTHSMIIRRTGMKKILDHAKKNRIFLPYDHEIAIPEDIRLFNLTFDLVTHAEDSLSDTRASSPSQEQIWKQYKENIMADIPKITGLYNLSRADKLLEFIYDKKPGFCVEIGALGGSVTYQISKVLSFLNRGHLYAIDAWDSALASENLSHQQDIQFWNNVNMNAVKQGCLQLILNQKLMPFCSLIQNNSKYSAPYFADESIDFLYLDGNSSEEGSLTDVTTFFPKVKKDGYICLVAGGALRKKLSTGFLMKHCKWIQEYSNAPDSLIFQKKA